MYSINVKTTPFVQKKAVTDWKFHQSPCFRATSDLVQDSIRRLQPSLHHLLHTLPITAHRRQILIPILGNNNIILDPHTSHPPIPRQHALVHNPIPLAFLQLCLERVLSEVDSRFIRNHAPNRQWTTFAEVCEVRVGIIVVGVSAAVVRVHAKIVAEPMGEEACHDMRVQDLFDREVSVENPYLAKTSCADCVSFHVHVFPHHACTYHLETFTLHTQNEIVDLFAFFCEFSVFGDGEGTCYVCAVAIVFAPGVEEDVVFAFEGLVVVDVVQGTACCSRSTDTSVSHFFAAVGVAVHCEHGVELALV